MDNRPLHPLGSHPPDQTHTGAANAPFQNDLSSQELQELEATSAPSAPAPQTYMAYNPNMNSSPMPISQSENQNAYSSPGSAGYHDPDYPHDETGHFGEQSTQAAQPMSHGSEEQSLLHGQRLPQQQDAGSTDLYNMTPVAEHLPPSYESSSSMPAPLEKAGAASMPVSQDQTAFHQPEVTPGTSQMPPPPAYDLSQSQSSGIPPTHDQKLPSDPASTTHHDQGHGSGVPSTLHDQRLAEEIDVGPGHSQHSTVPAFYPPPTDASHGSQPVGYISHEQAQRPSDVGAQDQKLPQRDSIATSYYAPPPPPRSPNPSSSSYIPPPPPRRVQPNFKEDDVSSPVSYIRDPHKLIAYLIPFPKPRIHVKGADLEKIPTRFLIYTPPPPPLSKPAEGVKEDRMHKMQRKWEEEVRSAKEYKGKTASWAGVKGKATKGISWAMSQTKSSNLEFLNRIVDDQKRSSTQDTHADDGVHEGEMTKRTVGLEEMVLIYPFSIPGTQDELRTEFVSSMMRSQSKAQRDAIIATGLIPVTAAIDILATVIWPFGGLLEIDSVWAYSSIRGAKTARSTTKRLNSTAAEGISEDETKIPPATEAKDKGKAKPTSKTPQLKLTFMPSQRLEILAAYLAARCHERNPHMFASPGNVPTESAVLDAIGWASSQPGARNWEDEQWEMSEVKEDVKSVCKKGAREWDKWVQAFEKDPVKALKK